MHMRKLVKETLVNAWIYNLISVPQIARLLLGDAIILSKTNLHNGSKKGKRSNSIIENNKSTLKVLPFIQILYLKQQSSILWCFSRLKFDKRIFSNTFFSFIFRSTMIVHTAEKYQIKYFAQNWLGKIAFFYVQTATLLSCCCHKLLVHHLGNCNVLKCITLWTTTTFDRIGTSSKHKKTKTI